MGGKKISRAFYKQRFKSKKERQELTKKILAKTGFRAEKESFANVVYQKNKVGSLHLSGFYQRKPAFLKIQLIDPGDNEAENILAFEKQNQSRLIRAPRVYEFQKYHPKRGYGYSIWEQVEGKFLRQICRTDRDHLKEFSYFYREFKKNSLSQPWQKKKKETVLESVTEYVETLETIYQKSGVSILADLGYDYQWFSQQFLFLIKKYQSVLEKEFTHGHLGPDDILVDQKGKYVIFSHLYWGWYLIDYDFVFYFWALSLLPQKANLSALKKLYSFWQEGLKTIKKKGFNQKVFDLVVIERLLGSILVQISVSQKKKEEKLIQLEPIIIFFQELIKKLN